MKPVVLAMLAVAMMLVATPVVASAFGASHSDHGKPATTPPCDFDHPASLPSHASPNAAEAHADRAEHCATVVAK